MYVIKRDGRREKVQFDKITTRISKLCHGLHTKYVDPIQITRLVVESVKSGITTSELDQHTASISASLAVSHPDYAILGGRIAISNLQKNTYKKFSSYVTALYNYHNKSLNKHIPLVSKELYDIVMNDPEYYDNLINSQRDLENYDYFGFKTLERSYLIQMDEKVVETPQYMLLRVAIGIHGECKERVKETYELMSNKYFTHATPTLFNSGTVNNQLASCYLLRVAGDSIDGIMDTAKNMALLSKFAGGIGIHAQNVRARGSYIAGTNGYSNGIVPFLRMYDRIIHGINQGGKRPGSATVYLDIWHADLLDFLSLGNPHKDTTVTATSLFYAILVNKEFMDRVKNKEMWSLFCPHECPLLLTTYGDEFVKVYREYEKDESKIRSRIPANEIWKEIIETMILTGNPFILDKDEINYKSNHRHLGILSGSNLCTEIIIYTDDKEIGTCNLASISLPRFIDPETNTFDFDKLIEITRIITYNLNCIIDKGFYPVEEAKRSNFRHRPIGIGIQGLYDAIIMLGHPMTSDFGKQLNRNIIEAIYYGFVTESCRLAKIHGPYESFKGSPLSEGKLQFDLWADRGHYNLENLNEKYNWNQVREDVKTYGLRNSLGLALMPTASTSNIMGYTECFQAPMSNIYVRKVLSGEFPITNKYLVNDLDKLGLWTTEIRNKIIANDGSIAKIAEIPYSLKRKYLTMFEESGRDLVDMEADRGPFVCQTQSVNRFINKIDDSYDFEKLASMLLYSHSRGLKTLSYYIRMPPSRDAVKSTIDPEKAKVECTEEICTSCQS